MSDPSIHLISYGDGDYPQDPLHDTLLGKVELILKPIKNDFCFKVLRQLYQLLFSYSA